MLLNLNVSVHKCIKNRSSVKVKPPKGKKRVCLKIAHLSFSGKVISTLWHDATKGKHNINYLCNPKTVLAIHRISVNEVNSISF